MQTQDLIGQQLGNYRLTALLGKGGFATVYLAEHIFLGNQAKAAIKVLNETNLSEEDRQNFTIEARTIRKLNHPHIVKLLDFGIEVSRHVDGSIPYLVMDYAPEGTLRNHHPLKSVVPIKRIVSYIDQLTDGLQYAHDQGIVHSDLKPENMLIMGVDDIVLSDFGIAITSFDSKNHQMPNDGVVQGTFPYIAPERFRGTTGRSSDQYSLGIVVYEWLTGTHPFKGTPEQIISNHLFTPPPTLYGIYPGISQELEAVVMRALAKEPEQRFPSVKDFAQALCHAAQSVIQFDIPPRQDYTEVSEQKVTPPYSSGSTVTMDQLSDSGAMITEKTNPLKFARKKEYIPDQQVYARQKQLDSDEQMQQTNTDTIQPVHLEQPVSTHEQHGAGAEQEQVGSTGQKQQTYQVRQAQENQDQKQQIHIDYQTWQQIMDYSARRDNRQTSRPTSTAPKPAASVRKTSSFKNLAVTLRRWFELEPEFARIPKNRTFRNLGMVLNALSAVLIGIVALPQPSGWLMFLAALYSLVLFNVCIRLINAKLAIATGLLVSAYWGIVGLVIFNGVYQYGPYISTISPFLIKFLSPSLVALFFFAVSVYLHIRYVLNRLP